MQRVVASLVLLVGLIGGGCSVSDQAPDERTAPDLTTTSTTTTPPTTTNAPGPTVRVGAEVLVDEGFAALDGVSVSDVGPLRVLLDNLDQFTAEFGIVEP